MKVMRYQAKVGDGVNMSTVKRLNTFFSTPQDAIAEALCLKEKMDSKYEKNIKWDFEGKITESKGKMKILKGYLNGDRKTHPFYLEVQSSEQKKDIPTATPLKNKKSPSKKELKMAEKAELLFQ
jgi:hypothetical protein